MINNNGAAVRKLSNRSLKNNRMRNLFAVAAIALTGILFTAVFSMMSGIMQTAQESTMREVGGRFHVGLKGATWEQYEKVAADPMVVKSSYDVLIGRADNIVKWQAEIRYLPEEDTLYDMFIELEEGHLPTAENEIVVNTFVFDELNLPYALGEKIPLTYRFMDQTIEEEFVVSGWYEGDYVSHASELFVSERYWERIKGALTDEDFLRWQEEHPEDRDVGLYAGNLFFDNSSNLEDKIRTAIRNAGYEPETELDYGVNWAYMSSRTEAADPFTIIILCSAVFVILVTGYLIIYNIFQISVMSDIRFYGLLKTIGTTTRQIRRLVRRQALMLSVIGIPIGLLIGYGIGKCALPFVLSFSDYSGVDVSLRLEPWILVFGAAFSVLTVIMSSRKPAKIAGSISPMEAVRYTETDLRGKAGAKKRRRIAHKRFSAFSMALSNLGRNKRTTVIVIAAISFSMILLSIIMTAVGSFRIEQFMEERIVGDFMLGNINLTSGSPRSGVVEIEPAYLALADQQAGIEGRREMWTRFRTNLQVDEQARKRLQKLDAEGKLRRNGHSEENLDLVMRGEKAMVGFFYGYDDGLLSQLNVLDGTLDIDKFRTGDYVLLTQILGGNWLPAEDHIWHPGDKVTVEMFTENSTCHEVTNETGETIDVIYENMEEKEYEVMAIVEIPDSMNLKRYSSNACDVVLPLPEATTLEPEWQGGDENLLQCWQRFMVSYEVREEDQAAFEAAVRGYTDSHAMMGYRTKESLRKEFDNMVTVIASVGISLAAVIALIGILNFINAIVTGIISRRREFAVLQSIGMTDEQLQKTLICEGSGYIVIAGSISLVVGSALSYLIVNALNHLILFFEYRFQVWSFVIMIPILMLVAAVTPSMAYRRLSKKSIVERLREGE